MGTAMTLLQKEQEQPQVKAGPTRHAKIMRGIVTPIFGLLAVACVVLGVLNATTWKPSTQITASASVSGSEYVVTDPGTLSQVDDTVTVSAKAKDSSTNVCIVTGAARDVNGWIAGSKYTRITGLSDWTTLSAQKASAQGSADDSENQVALADSDMWRDSKCDTGTVSMEIKNSSSSSDEAVIALIDFGDGEGSSVTFDWTRSTVPDFAMPFYFAGGLLAVLAVLSASVFAMPPHKRRHPHAIDEAKEAETVEETATAAWAQNALENAARNENPKKGPRRRRHASGTAKTESQPTIVDPSARNLVADQQESASTQDGSQSGTQNGISDGETTSVISQEELMAYFARLAQEESEQSKSDTETSEKEAE